MHIDKSFKKVALDCGQCRYGSDKRARHTEIKQMFVRKMEMKKEMQSFPLLVASCAKKLLTC